MSLTDTFNAVSPLLVATEVRVTPGPSEGKQTIRVKANHTKSAHQFIYYSTEHAVEDAEEHVKRIAHKILGDHWNEHAA